MLASPSTQDTDAARVSLKATEAEIRAWLAYRVDAEGDLLPGHAAEAYAIRLYQNKLKYPVSLTLRAALPKG
jgi:hypothetical protein